jgi:signal peptidase II
VASRLELYENVPIIPHYLDITYTQNPGAAFSIFTDLPPWFRIAFLMTLATVAIVALAVLIARSDGIDLTSVAFAFILAGALGNLIDRIRIHGRVIDFIRVHYYGWNYPIFNVADSAISIGVTLIVLGMLFGGKSPAK